MKPVDQTTFGAPGGNCFSACIASILHLPIDEVPYFMSDDVNGREWIANLGEWLKPRGMYPLILSEHAKVPGIHILHGTSPRGPTRHAVVALGDTIIHDPHPSRKGIRDVKEKTVLVPYEPHKVKP